MLRTGSKESLNHENNNNNQKVYPQPIDDTINPKNPSMETLIPKIFDNVSSLKAAYIQLQNAHTPYDPDKIQAADKLVIEELTKLSELKHSYRDHNPRPAPTSTQDSRLSAEIQEQQSLLKTYEVMVKKFQSQIQTRDSEIIQLQQRKMKMEKKLKQKGFVYEDVDFFLVELTPALFSSAVETACKAVHDFSKPLINMMKAAGWDLDAAARAIDPGVVYGKRAHKKYAFESHICRRMFSGFQEESYGDVSVCSEGFFQQFLAIRGMDPLDMLSQSPDSVFGRFCRRKYLEVVHEKMEKSFFGSLDQRSFVVGGGHPRTPFYQAFLKLAKSVWLLHRLAYSFERKVEVFQVKGGSEFSEVYMESVVKGVVVVEEEEAVVGLMVMPGFLVGETVIQSQVYLSNVKYSE